MAIKNIIAQGIGFSPGSTSYIVTLGFSSDAADLPAVSSITWSIGVDLTGDGTYGDTGEDLGDYVQGAIWQLGFSQPYDAIARAATLTLTLKNTDRRFSPENTGSPLYPAFTRGKVVRIQSTWNDVTTTHYLGWIDSIEPLPGQKKERYTVVQCSGYLIMAQDAEVFIEAQEDVSADEVIQAILDAAGILPPGFSGQWRLGTSGSSELGATTYLGQIDIELEAGISTFEIIGDQWGDGVSTYGALRDTVGREGGRLYVDRSGTITFWSRHHLILDTVVDASFDDTMAQMEYSYGDDVINHVIVRANPRSIGESNETLGQIDKAVRIRAGSTKTVSIRYRDQSGGAKIAGKNAVTPVGSTDYTANTQEDGSGTDITGFVTAAISEESATRSKVTYSNTAPLDAYVQAGAQIRGIKITDWGESDVEVEDDDSISAHRRHRFTYPFVMDTLDAAEGMAYYILSNRKDARGLVRSITIPAYRSSEVLEQALTRTIGDRITVAETQTGTDGDYFIIGEQFNLGKKQLSVTWFLEPADTSPYWILGRTNYSELGAATYLGPL